MDGDPVRAVELDARLMCYRRRACNLRIPV